MELLKLQSLICSRFEAVSFLDSRWLLVKRSYCARFERVGVLPVWWRLHVSASTLAVGLCP